MNCHLYYICEPLGDGTYRVHMGDCGLLYWDQELHTCVRVIPAEADCLDGTPLPALFTPPTSPEPGKCLSTLCLMSDLTRLI